MPILRPLVGMDKNEIIVEARKLGTFETSILPDEDCCTLFTPPHPETHARQKEVDESEARLDVDRMVNDAIAQTEVVRLSFPQKFVLPLKKRAAPNGAALGIVARVQALARCSRYFISFSTSNFHSLAALRPRIFARCSSLRSFI